MWTKTVGGPANDIGLSMVPAFGGGYVISGETDSYGAGYFDAFVMKLDENGSVIWNKTFGGAGNDYGEAIVRTTDSCYAIGGYTSSYGMGDYDMYITKIDQAGNIMWTRTVGSAGYDYALSIVETIDKGFALCGSTSAFGQGYTDLYMAKLDSNGNLQWSRTVGGTQGDFGSYIIQSTDGGYVLAGVTLSFGAGQYDIYIVKLSSSGALEWTRTVGGADFEYLYSIIQCSDGGYAAAGSTASYGAGGYDEFTLKLNSAGVLEWAKSIGGTGDDAARTVIQTPMGYLTAGESGSFGAGGFDMFITGLDSLGNSCGNTFSHSPSTGSGGVISSPVSIVTAPTMLYSTPSPSAGLGGNMNSICIIGIHSISNEIPSSFELYQNFPNPFNPITHFGFRIADFGSVNLSIFDILGREVETLVKQELNPGTYEAEWNAGNFPGGVYYYRLSAKNHIETKKMVLVK